MKKMKKMKKNNQINLSALNKVVTRCELNTTYIKSSLLDSLDSKIQMTEKEFFEWLAGFTDAEGTFYVGVSLSQKVSFKYQIGLHIDDRQVLEFIISRLGFGKIYSHKNSVTLVINKHEDIAKIIDIFKKYPLQSTKWLNFCDFTR
jgi:hypothetical protein